MYNIDELVNEGAKIIAFDPEAMANVKKEIGDKIEYADDMYAVLQGADALLICTEWQVFRAPDFSILKEALSAKVIFDGRNLYNKEEVESLGFEYYSIGR